MFWACVDEGGGGGDDSESDADEDAGDEEAIDGDDDFDDDYSDEEDDGSDDDSGGSYFGLLPFDRPEPTNPFGLSLGADDWNKRFEDLIDQVDSYSPGDRSPASDGNYSSNPSAPKADVAPPTFAIPIPTPVPDVYVRLLYGANGPGVGVQAGQDFSVYKTNDPAVPNVSLTLRATMDYYPLNPDKSNIGFNIGGKVGPIPMGVGGSLELGEARDGTQNYLQMLYNESLRQIGYPSDSGPRF